MQGKVRCILSVQKRKAQSKLYNSIYITIGHITTRKELFNKN